MSRLSFPLSKKTAHHVRYTVAYLAMYFFSILEGCILSFRTIFKPGLREGGGTVVAGAE